MNKNEFWVLLLWGGLVLLASAAGPYQRTGGRNGAPRYGRSRNDRIPPSYKQIVGIAAAIFAIEAVLVFIGMVFFELLPDRVLSVLYILGHVIVGLGFVACTAVLAIHESREKRWLKITRGKKHFTQKELREYEDLLYRRRRKDGKKAG